MTQLLYYVHCGLLNCLHSTVRCNNLLF